MVICWIEMIEYGWTFHFWDAFINRQIDSVIVMTHNYGVKFQKPWKVTFNIQTFQKSDFSVKFPYGVCILKLAWFFTEQFFEYFCKLFNGLGSWWADPFWIQRSRRWLRVNHLHSSCLSYPMHPVLFGFKSDDIIEIPKSKLFKIHRNKVWIQPKSTMWKNGADRRIDITWGISRQNNQQKYTFIILLQFNWNSGWTWCICGSGQKGKRKINLLVIFLLISFILYSSFSNLMVQKKWKKFWKKMEHISKNTPLWNKSWPWSGEILKYQIVL